MFVVNEDMSIYCTRGDCGTLIITAEEDGIPYIFQPEDVVRVKVFSKKACASVVLQREVMVNTATDTVGIYLPGAVTKFGDVISKPADYWYEVELNPYTTPKTIIGYDEDGAKLFRLYPEGKDVTQEEAEDLPQVPFYDMVAEALERAKATGMFDGEPGYTPQKGVDYNDGKNGKDGETPVKGEDYWTDEDKAEIIRAVLDSMPHYAGETGDIT